MQRALAGSSALRGVIERYRQLGYSVVIDPEPADLPAFLEGFRPDVLALSPSTEGGVVVELSTGVGVQKREYLAALAERVRANPGWRLDVIGIPREPSLDEGDVPSVDELERLFAEAKELIEAGRDQAGFLLLWSAIEGALRGYVAQAKLRVPTERPIEMLTGLVSEGVLDATHYQALRDAYDLRSRWAHGLRPASAGTEVVIDRARQVADLLLQALHAGPGRALHDRRV